jgi:hypothetical protein
METILSMSNDNDLWTKSIQRILTNSFDEEIFVNAMAHDLLLNYKQEILNVACKLVNQEISKRKNIDLRMKLLIRNQIYNNLTENITNIVLNMAKEYYDNNIKETFQMNEYEHTHQHYDSTFDDFDKMVEDNSISFLI